MKRQTPLWLLGGRVWLGAFAIITGLIVYVNSRRPGTSGKIDWLFVSVGASALAGAVVMEEYLELVGTSRLPADHHLYLPNDA